MRPSSVAETARLLTGHWPRMYAACLRHACGVFVWMGHARGMRHMCGTVPYGHAHASCRHGACCMLSLHAWRMRRACAPQVCCMHAARMLYRWLDVSVLQNSDKLAAHADWPSNASQRGHEQGSQRPPSAFGGTVERLDKRAEGINALHRSCGSLGAAAAERLDLATRLCQQEEIASKTSLVLWR